MNTLKQSVWSVAFVSGLMAIVYGMQVGHGPTVFVGFAVMIGGLLLTQ